MPKTTISRTYCFESAHRLPLLPETHKCHHLHGHNYKMIVEVAGEIDERGFIIDFFDLDKVVDPLIKLVDHKILNEVKGLENPTAENISLWFLEKISIAQSIKVFENDDCWAESRSAS